MSKIRNPQRFSAHFGLSPRLLKRRGAFDPIVNADTLLFIDPLLLKKSAHPEMRAAHRDWMGHFNAVIKLLRVATGPGDAPWRAAERLFTAKEFKGTCLGYGSGTIVGSGIGPTLRARLLKTAKRIIDLGVQDPTLFPLLALLEEDIGADRISDMTTRAIGRRLAEFTVRVLKGTTVPQSVFKIDGHSFPLPKNPMVYEAGKAIPVVLVPTDVLRDLPIASDWSDVDRVKSENEALRKRINEAIGAVWLRHASETKRANKTAFLRSREAFESLLAAAHAVPKRPYDTASDPSGRIWWLELGQSAAEKHPIQLALTQQNAVGVRNVVSEIIDHYKHTIEHRDLWKSLYDSNKKPHHEPYAQRLFYAMALSFCKANNLAIVPEANAGGGPVDFVVSSGFHAQIVVELKLSTNPNIEHGYTTQLEVYKSAHQTDHGFFVILDIGGGEAQMEDVLNLESTAKSSGAKYSPVIIVDATPKKSASRR